MGVYLIARVITKCLHLLYLAQKSVQFSVHNKKTTFATQRRCEMNDNFSCNNRLK